MAALSRKDQVVWRCWMVTRVTSFRRCWMVTTCWTRCWMVTTWWTRCWMVTSFRRQKSPSVTAEPRPPAPRFGISYESLPKAKVSIAGVPLGDLEPWRVPEGLLDFRLVAFTGSQEKVFSKFFNPFSNDSVHVICCVSEKLIQVKLIN